MPISFFFNELERRENAKKWKKSKVRYEDDEYRSSKSRKDKHDKKHKSEFSEAKKRNKPIAPALTPSAVRKISKGQFRIASYTDADPLSGIQIPRGIEHVGHSSSIPGKITGTPEAAFKNRVETRLYDKHGKPYSVSPSVVSELIKKVDEEGGDVKIGLGFPLANPDAKNPKESDKIMKKTEKEKKEAENDYKEIKQLIKQTKSARLKNKNDGSYAVTLAALFENYNNINQELVRSSTVGNIGEYHYENMRIITQPRTFYMPVGINEIARKFTVTMDVQLQFEKAFARVLDINYKIKEADKGRKYPRSDYDDDMSYLTFLRSCVDFSEHKKKKESDETLLKREISNYINTLYYHLLSKFELEVQYV